MHDTRERNQVKTVDALIIGGGPAGFNCALELHDSRQDYVLLDRAARLGGQLLEVENTIRNFAAGFWQDGRALADDLEKLSQKLAVHTLHNQVVEKVDLANRLVTAAADTYKAKSIFLATGTRMRTLSFAGDADLTDSIIYSVESNEARIKDKTVAVVGGGDNALMDALWLAKRCSAVLLVHRSEQFRAIPDVVRDVLSNPRINVFTQCEVVAVKKGDSGNLSAVVLRDKTNGSTTEHAADFLAVRVGFAPNSELFEGQIDLDAGKYVVVDLHCKTSMDGIYAGGDLVAPPYLGIARAAGHGLIAARAMIAYMRSNPFKSESL